MMEAWKYVELGNICKIKGGKRLPKGHNLTEKVTSHPYIRARDIKEGKINFDQPVYVEDDTFQKISRYIVNEGQVILTIAGTVAEVALVTNEFDKASLTENAVKIIVDETQISAMFLKFLCQSDHIKSYFELIASGAAQPKLGIYKIQSTKVNLPSLPTQRKIASILSTYDDLIENNLKRIKLLEEKAQQTYEEWFVRMKFPGHETAPINKETGLPEGWKKIKVANYVEIISKGPSLKYDLPGVKYPVLNQSCIRNGEIELDKVLYAKELSENKKELYLKINDILINSMGQGTLGRVSKNVSINEKFIIHNCITFLRSKDEYSQFLLFYFISSHQTFFENIAQGSTGQSTLKKELVAGLDILLPEENILASFDEIISPCWKEMGLLKRQNQLLKEARDALLPRLMTGMIDVDDIEFDYPKEK